MDKRPWANMAKLSLTWLETFMTVLENKGSQVAAAGELGISEGTVSRQMKQLRRWVGGAPARIERTDRPYVEGSGGCGFD